MTHIEQIAELNHECWVRAKAHLWVQLGREPLPWELTAHVLNSQLYMLVMTTLNDAERIQWFKDCITIVQQGMPQGMTS